MYFLNGIEIYRCMNIGKVKKYNWLDCALPAIRSMFIVIALLLFDNMGISMAGGMIRVERCKVANCKDIVNKKNQINHNVQLKENVWVKIIDDYYEEETYGEVTKRLELTPPSGMENKLLCGINVQVQFLKPCKAKNKAEELAEELRKKYPNKDDLIPISEFDVAKLIYKYDCDYRTKVFVTVYDWEGNEIKTQSDYISGEYENSKLKEVLLPGEKALTSISVPCGASYYYSWVPR